jgi:hypothetical protein
MESPLSVLEQYSIETQATPAEIAQLVSAGEELLSRVKIVAQRIDERCHQIVEADRSPQASGNRLAGS